MLRRDYILRMIQQAAEMLARIQSLKKERRWADAQGDLDAELQNLVGANLETVASLSQTELLARVIRGESTLAVKEKTFVLSALLKEAGDIAAAQDRDEEGRSCYLKGLHLLLDALSESDTFEFPEFFPRVEMFVSALADAPLPLQTQAGLMQHYERTGQFAKAEDALFAMLEAYPDNPDLLDFGIAFYQRLKSQSDDHLTLGNLPRSEAESSLADLRSRRSSQCDWLRRGG